MTDQNCIFCKIVNKEISHNKVYEDEKVIAFLDMFPVNEGHTLVIPKEHLENIYEIPDELLSHVAMISKKMAIKIKNAMKADGINVYMNNESAAGQVIGHAHVHIIPRFIGDGYSYWKNKKSYTQEEKKKTAEKIVKEI